MHMKVMHGKLVVPKDMAETIAAKYLEEKHWHITNTLAVEKRKASSFRRRIQRRFVHLSGV